MNDQVGFGDADERSGVVQEGVDEIVADSNWSRLIKNEARLPCKVNESVPGYLVMLNQVCCSVDIFGVGNVAQV